MPDVEVKRIYKEENEDELTEKKKKVEEIFEDVEKNNKPDKPEDKTETEAKKEEEARQKLLEDNQVLSAINVIKGIMVFSKF